MTETIQLFEREKKDPVLLFIEISILLMTILAVPVLCIKPISGEPSLAILLIQKIIPSVLLVHIAISAIWDARNGMTVPYFFVISVVLFALSCITQAVDLNGPSFFVGFYVDDVWLGRILCLAQVPIAVALCVLFCVLTGFFEEKLKRPLCGGGDIKCLVAFFFFPLHLDYVCRCVLSGLILLLFVSLYVTWKKGMKVPVRGLPWIYLGTVPALLYYY